MSRRMDNQMRSVQLSAACYPRLQVEGTWAFWKVLAWDVDEIVAECLQVIGNAAAEVFDVLSSRKHDLLCGADADADRNTHIHWCSTMKLDSRSWPRKESTLIRNGILIYTNFNWFDAVIYFRWRFNDVAVHAWAGGIFFGVCKISGSEKHERGFNRVDPQPSDWRSADLQFRFYY